MLGMIEIVLITFKEIKLFTSQWRKELLCGMFSLLNIITAVGSLSTDTSVKRTPRVGPCLSYPLYLTLYKMYTYLGPEGVGHKET